MPHAVLAQDQLARNVLYVRIILFQLQEYVLALLELIWILSMGTIVGSAIRRAQNVLVQVLVAVQIVLQPLP